MELTPDWTFVADTVMGGVSTGALSRVTLDGRAAVQLRGDVSLDNDGGFVQMAGDLGQPGPLDASAWTGVEVDIWGNGEVYDLRLRTDDLARPWQSYRAEIIARPAWHRLQVPFADFVPHKTDMPLNTARLRRIGVLGIGRVFRAEVAVARLGLYV
ncbi:hypothetical protein JANAI62_01470 [Jannaschia pagri]|uniref:NADH:ubiquinone oxidoreductase intermediate-associated protein 30 domain-containing protein n=1 Tax=Jannaschia pagri TaxID=2829797 RepID=A0ABQ4NH38_9RHOB|nr:MULTISPECIES: CIA30 family protein [unclassified Jannaschia]GIT90370.1 hypothetical protein JANAI61_08280 [Jannaschia sp. AI_61]GIT93524.1 hypothetical protein JANAI62_01470 [Jannaschia sp. AI_62]